MLTKKQMEIFGVFNNHMFTELTFREIKEQSKQKSNNVLQLAIKQFKKEKLLIIKKVGNVTTYKPALENNRAISYLNTIYEITKEYPHTKILQDIEKKIRKKTVFFILGVFGSFAKKTAKKNSDLDIMVFVETQEIRKEITPIIETIKRREIQEIDYHIITIKEFQEMLETDYENLGKQIYKNNKIYYGYTQYIKILSEVNT